MRLFIVVGLPGAGKTTWLAANAKQALSSDHVRELITGDAADQNANRTVFPVLRSLALARLNAGCDETWIDSTALTRFERRCWIRWAELHHCPVEAVYFDTPLEICRLRNSGRDRPVPTSAFDRMAARLSPPSPEEGFDRLTIIPG